MTRRVERNQNGAACCSIRACWSRCTHATILATLPSRSGWADISLVWLAETTGITRIATLDVTDFSVYRIHGRKRFELELLR